MELRLLGIPGRPYRGPLPELTADQINLLKRLEAHVVVLAGDIGARSLTSAPQNLEIAAAYIESEMRRITAEVKSQQFTVDVFTEKNAVVTESGISFKSVSHVTRNIVAEIKGDSPEIVIVGAHYDSVYDCPAANDNASGVAALLELLSCCSRMQPKRTVRFVAFSNEEPPFFNTESMGSYVYANECRSNGENIVGMLALETIGYYSRARNSQMYPNSFLRAVCPNQGDFVLFVSNIASRKLLADSIKAFRMNALFPSEAMALPAFIPGVSFSDHGSFWRCGFPALMVTDTANYRYPHYHTADDTPDKIDFESLTRVVSGLQGVVRALGKG